jgi:hypothetical protein
MTRGVLDPLGRRQVRTSHLAAAADISGVGTRDSSSATYVTFHVATASQRWRQPVSIRKEGPCRVFTTAVG